MYGSTKVKNGWAIAHWEAGVYIDTVRPTRWQAIEAFRQQYHGVERDWQPCAKCATNKAVKIQVFKNL